MTAPTKAPRTQRRRTVIYAVHDYLQKHPDIEVDINDLDDAIDGGRQTIASAVDALIKRGFPIERVLRGVYRWNSADTKKEHLIDPVASDGHSEAVSSGEAEEVQGHEVIVNGNAPNLVYVGKLVSGDLVYRNGADDLYRVTRLT